MESCNILKVSRSDLAWPSGEGHGLAFMWREFNPSPTWSCITEAFSLQIKAVSITADGAQIYLYPFKKKKSQYAFGILRICQICIDSIE